MSERGGDSGAGCAPWASLPFPLGPFAMSHGAQDGGHGRESGVGSDEEERVDVARPLEAVQVGGQFLVRYSECTAVISSAPAGVAGDPRVGLGRRQASSPAPSSSRYRRSTMGKSGHSAHRPTAAAVHSDHARPTRTRPRPLAVEQRRRQNLPLTRRRPPALAAARAPAVRLDTRREPTRRTAAAPERARETQRRAS